MSKVLRVGVLGVGAMLSAWFLRSCIVEGVRRSFPGWVPFRAFEYEGAVFYFRPFVPLALRGVGHRGVAGLARSMSWDEQLLFLHEAWGHALRGVGHAPAGIMALNMATRRRTTLPGDVAVAWHEVEATVDAVEVGA